jgi:hypothetical protein
MCSFLVQSPSPPKEHIPSFILTAYLSKASNLLITFQSPAPHGWRYCYKSSFADDNGSAFRQMHREAWNS